MSMFNPSPATKIRATEGFVPNVGMIHSDDEKKRRDDRKSEKVILISEKMRIFANSIIRIADG